MAHQLTRKELYNGVLFRYKPELNITPNKVYSYHRSSDAIVSEVLLLRQLKSSLQVEGTLLLSSSDTEFYVTTYRLGVSIKSTFFYSHFETVTR